MVSEQIKVFQLKFKIKVFQLKKQLSNLMKRFSLCSEPSKLLETVLSPFNSYQSDFIFIVQIRA